MSSVDLSAAVAAAHMACENAYEVWRMQDNPGPYPEAFGPMVQAAIAAALPHIEAAVREQVAREIEAVDPVEWALAGMRAGDDAARIARGQS